jgi:alpha-galactosidase
LAESVPGKWYLKDPDTVKAWKFGLTKVSWRKEDLKNRLERSIRLKNGQEDFQIRQTGEEGVKQIKAILGLGDLVTNVNIPNIGQMQDVPYGAVVETNALFRRDSVTPIMAGKLPSAVHSLVIRQIENQETILKAALTKDKKLAFAAFINDPLVTISFDEAEELFEEMLQNTKKYLPSEIL